MYLYPWDKYSISRVKSGLLELSQNVLISAGISQRSGYPGISPIFSAVVSLELGYPGIVPLIFVLKKDILTFFGFFWDIPGYPKF